MHFLLYQNVFNSKRTCKNEKGCIRLPQASYPNQSAFIIHLIISFCGNTLIEMQKACKCH